MWASRLIRAVVASGFAAAGGDLAELQADLQAIAESRAVEYNCSFSVSAFSPSLGGTLTAASAGVAPDRKFVWGSITKMFTGASVMQLVSRGDLSLGESFAPYVNAQFAAMRKIGLPGMNFSTVSDLWGPEVDKVTIRDLLHMESGIPDFDTAVPSRHGKPVDPFRATVYAHPAHDYAEPELLSLPWVATKSLNITPGSRFQYSSTNFGLLGLILSLKAGVADYRNFNQSAFIPDDLSHVAREIAWAQRGSPRDHGAAEGFDRTTYNGQDPSDGGVSVADVHGVFSGWAASDFLGPPRAVSELGYALWGKEGSLLPARLRDMMIPRPLWGSFYGLASQNVGLLGITGCRGKLRTAYGHLGATYGYDSIYAYSPELDVSIAIATNIESTTQTQPSDAFCHVFNRIKNHLTGGPVETCSYKSSGYYGGVCTCTAAGASVFV